MQNKNKVNVGYLREREYTGTTVIPSNLTKSEAENTD